MLTLDLMHTPIDQLLGFSERIMKSESDLNYTNVLFADNVAIKIPTRAVVLNMLFWEPNMQFGIRPTHDDFTNFKSITTDAICSVQSRLYKKAIRTLTDIPHMRIAMSYLYNIDRLSNFTQRYLGVYMPSLDALGLSRLMKHPSVQKLASHKFDDKMGTKVAEEQFKTMSEELCTLLKTIPERENCLRPYMHAKTLKSNQIPQFMLAYCGRSDIDDVMMRHVISDSSFSGLKSVEDFAIEMLSARKAIHFSRDVIRKSQYFGRKMRLACAAISKIYPGSCGSPGWIPFTIDANYSDNYIDRIVIDDDGRRVILTKKNMKNYVGRQIRLVSQFACRHTDGICEHCAGYGEDMLIRYMPADIHIGLLSSMKTSSIVSQKILSTKHLIATLTKLYILSQSASEVFMNVGDAIFWKPEMKQVMSRITIRIPVSAFLSPISDLNLDILPSSVSFTKVPYIEIWKDDDLITTADLEADMFEPHLSDECLEWMQENYSALTVDDEVVSISMGKFDISRPFMKTRVMNDDMYSYTKRVTNFLSKRMASYTSVEACLRDFNATVYQKSSLNSFFLETVVRAHLISGPSDYRIPIVTDPNHVHFGNLADVISETSVTGKLAFEHVKDYISTARTPVIAKRAGLFAPYFGIV